jgi:nitrate reductase gamma subunit
LTLGLVTLPYSLSHADGSVMLVLSDWVQRVATFRVGAAEGLIGVAWPYKAHLVLGMTLFLLFPFTRLVHVWSGFATLTYPLRPRQVVRSRRLNLPGARDAQREAGAGVETRRGNPVTVAGHPRRLPGAAD